MLENYRKKYNGCIEKLSDVKISKKIYLVAILSFGTGIFAFISQFFIEKNVNNNPITHMFVGLSMGFFLTIFMPFIQICITNKKSEKGFYIFFIIMWIIFLENEKTTGLVGQETDIFYNLLGAIAAILFYKRFL